MQKLLGLNIVLAAWILNCKAFIPPTARVASSSRVRIVLGKNSGAASREDLDYLEQEAVTYVGPTADTGVLEDVEFAAVLEECET